MSAGTGAGWAQVRQQIRSVESQTENLFQNFSQHASSSTTLPPKPSPEEEQIENDINALLDQRETLISQLSRLLDSESTQSTSTLKQNNLNRHRELLTDHRGEVRRIKQAISEARDRQHLLTNVRSDISAFRSQQSTAEAEAEYMLQERGRLDNSHNVIDGVLAQAYAINDQFGIQRETLANINRRITSAAAALPGVNGLIQRIGTKKRRDGIILGSFIAFCFLAFFWFS